MHMQNKKAWLNVDTVRKIATARDATKFFTFFCLIKLAIFRDVLRG